MIMIDDEEFLSAREAADFLGVKVATLYAYASRGRVHSFRRGQTRRTLYRRQELEAMMRLEHGAPRTRLPRAEDWIPYT
jgi:citrate synthase